MEPINLETTDIFRGAFLLASGGDLAGIHVRNNGKRIATFLITGKDLDRLDRDYRSGRALINPVQLRESLNHLRDVLFEKLREGRTRYDDRREVIEQVKRTDLVALVQAKGIQLKKNGNGSFRPLPLPCGQDPVSVHQSNPKPMAVLRLRRGRRRDPVRGAV